MPYFERDNSLNTAARIVRDRIRALPEFAEARGLVVLAATAECRGKSVAEMRELGGFSEVIRRHIYALGAKYRDESHGSKMFPVSVVDELGCDVPAMRDAVQLGCQPCTLASSRPIRSGAATAFARAAIRSRQWIRSTTRARTICRGPTVRRSSTRVPACTCHRSGFCRSSVIDTTR